MKPLSHRAAVTDVYDWFQNGRGCSINDVVFFVLGCVAFRWRKKAGDNHGSITSGV